MKHATNESVVVNSFKPTNYKRYIKKLLKDTKKVMAGTLVTLSAIAILAPAVGSAMNSQPVAYVAQQSVVCAATYCPSPTKGNDAKVRIDLGNGYASIDSVNFTFYFAARNAFDPSESWQLAGIGGPTNTSTSSTVTSTITLLPGQQGDFISQNFIGKKTAFVDFSMTNGSVQLVGVDVNIVGVHN